MRWLETSLADILMNGSPVLICRWNVKTFWVAWAVLQALAGVSLRPAGAEPAEPSIVAAHIVTVSGKVRIRKDGSKDPKDVRFARAGDTVMVGDVINTPSDGTIKLLLKDRSLMDLGPSSLFKLNAFKSNGGKDREVESTIAYGSLRAAVTQKLEGRGNFRVRSPSATMGVRGTEFVVKSDVTNLGALKGIMNAKPGERVMPNPAAGETNTQVTVLQGTVAMQTDSPPPQARGPAASAPMPGGAISSEGNGTLVLKSGAQVTARTGGQAPPAARAEVLDSGRLSQVGGSAKVADNTFSASVSLSGMTREEEKKAEKENKEAERRESKEGSKEGSKENSGTVASSDEGKKDDKKQPEASTASPANTEASGQASGQASTSGNSGPEASSQQQASTSEPAPAERAPAAAAPAAAPPPAAGTAAAPIAAPVAPAAPMAPPPSLAMTSLVQTVTASVQLGTNVMQTIRPADVVPAAIPATAIQAPPPVIPLTRLLRIRVNLAP